MIITWKKQKEQDWQSNTLWKLCESTNFNVRYDFGHGSKVADANNYEDWNNNSSDRLNHSGIFYKDRVSPSNAGSTILAVSLLIMS